MTIFGLGNAGLKYRSTRHNAGYMFCHKLAKVYNKRFSTRRGYRIARVKIGRKSVELIKPVCWMNQSGMAVAEILQEIDDEFMVVLDDFNLPLGKIRLRSRGSDGGHLGLRSIINSLRSSTFLRLRIGVGYPDQDVVSYVLTTFRRKEKKILISVIEEGIKGIEIMFKQGFTKAQNYINSINMNLLDSDR